MTTTKYRITGNEAVRLAGRDQLTPCCHENPIIPGAGPVTVGEAHQIAKEDPNLVYVDVVQNGWMTNDGARSEMEGYNISDYFSPDGSLYFGPDEDGVEPRWDDAQ